MLTAGGFLFFQVLLGPLVMDVSLKWLHSLAWTGLGGLPPASAAFLQDACRRKGLPVPRIGVIKDGTPNAFTYGRVPSDARLVVTSGLLEILDDDEAAAVLGHELGHIANYDMLVMTIASIVPVVLYGIYRACTKRSSGGSSKGKGQLAVIGVAAYLLYVLTRYLVLALSRLRELHADRWSAEVTGKPNALASALVKIAYGLAGREGEAEGGVGDLPAARMLGIFDPTSAKALAVSASRGAGGSGPSRENVLGAMQWDLWNPWADIHEMSSSHPLPAKRIEHLGRCAAALGQEPYARFDREKPESFLDEFLVDV
ncbi:MAG: M48B family peptidase, partial [Elusimicrobia bacterium]